MNRIEFMKQLERLLWDIPEQECRDAIDFYNAYFDDAGPENEAQVISELGSPGKVAAIIKADLKGSAQTETYGEYTETGYQDHRFSGGTQVPDRTNVIREREESGRRRSRGYQGRQTRSGGNLALVIVILVFTSPVWLGLAGGILGIVFGLVFGILGVVLGIGAGSLGLLAGGGAVIVSGILEDSVQSCSRACLLRSRVPYGGNRHNASGGFSLGSGKASSYVPSGCGWIVPEDFSPWQRR